MAASDNKEEFLKPVIEHIGAMIQVELKGKTLDVKTLDVGCTNYIFLVTYSGDADECNTLIAKYAPPYMKCYGPSFPLTANRLNIEFLALAKFEELYHGCVPKVIAYESEHKIMLLEHMRSFKVLRSELISSRVDLPALRYVACVIGQLHNKTHVSNIPEEQFAQLMKTFQGELVDLKAEFVFEKPFIAADLKNHVAAECQKPAQRIYGNQPLLANVQTLRQVFLTKKECLLHGDLNTGSVMVDNGDIKVVHTESAFMGPCSWDLGTLLAHYIISYHAHMLTPEDNQAHRQISYKMMDVCKTTVEAYLENMVARIGDSDQYVATVMSEAAGFAGMELISRAIGATPADDVRNDGGKEAEVLQSGERLVMRYPRIRSIGELLNIALMLT